MQVRMVIEVETMLPNWLRRRYITSSESITSTCASHPQQHTFQNDDVEEDDSTTEPTQNAEVPAVVSTEVLAQLFAEFERYSFEPSNACGFAAGSAIETLGK